MNSMEERISRHRRFWEREKTDRPLIGFRINKSYFPVQWFAAGENLRKDNMEIVPEMLNASNFAEECADIFRMHENTGQDLFWTAEPFTAVPWLEAMAGCKIYGSQNSLWAGHWLHDPAQLGKIKLESDNPWLKKYKEFLTALDQVSRGRFPIGQPILRGPLDMASTLRGASNFIMDFYDHPETISALIHKVTEMFIALVKTHTACVQPFYQGHSMGFYHLWTPGKCIWFQEDASALLSPDLYRSYAREADVRICQTYPYTLIHLHPASFFILDDLLSIEALKVIQVNKDTEGPSIADMLPVLKKILEKKCLFLWGRLTGEEVSLLLKELSWEGLGMQIFVESPEEALGFMEQVKSFRK